MDLLDDVLPNLLISPCIIEVPSFFLGYLAFHVEQYVYQFLCKD